MSISLNQVYQKEKTFELVPQVHSNYWMLDEYCKNKGFTNSENISKGRLYDYALLLSSNLDFAKMKICEVGARDSILGAYLTKFSNVHVSDYFQEWPELGDFMKWRKIWHDMAFNERNIFTEPQNVLALSYPENSYDLVIALAVIEHTHYQRLVQDIPCGDLYAIREMIRICKPNGYIFLSTRITSNYESVWYNGTLYYSFNDLKYKLLDQPEISLVDKLNEDFDEEVNETITRQQFKVSSVAILLKITK